MRSSSSRPASLPAAWCFALSVLLAQGCSATKVTQVWKDDAYQAGRPGSVLVVGMLKNDTARKTFESEFVKRFTERGIKATESFRVLPAVPVESEEARAVLVQKVQELGVNAVLLSRVTARLTKEQTIPGMTITTGFGMPYGPYGAWGGYAGVGFTVSSSGYDQPTTQGYSHETTFLVLETQLFDVRAEKLVWAVQSSTRVTGAPQQEIKPYVETVAKQLFNDRMFR